MNLRPVALAILIAPFCPGLSVAQGDPMAMARQMAANQLGLLEYCQGRGAVDDAPLTAQQAVMAHLPASAAPTGPAEALGKQGTLSANGSSMSLASMASSHNMSVDAMCKQLGSSAVQSAAMLKQQGGTPAMPSMSGGMPSMPSMPGGMAMPTMPSMPAVPGTPPR